MYHKVFELHADLLKALSHPKRLEILHLLRNKRMSVSEIQEMLDLAQANLSQHLTVLREAEVLETERKGKQVFYKLAHKNFIKASDLLRAVLVERNQNSEMADEFTQKMAELVPLAQDPVCGMRVSPKTAAFAYKYKDQKYYFCASGCLEAFKKSPGKYSGQKGNYER